MVKADLFCSSVAAASVLAKVERDAMMVALATTVPGYAWELNKGYSAPEHFAALESHGASAHHRRSWHLPGLGAAADVGRFPAPGMGGPQTAVMHDGAVRTEGASRAMMLSEAVSERGSQ
jgi:ribonuclease HII